MKISMTTSLMAVNQLQRTTKTISRSLERLSTGQRANRALDDAVTLSRDVKLNAQVRGLRAGIENANQAIGMVATAEGAISTQLEIVNRMRELALQASNGTLTATERSNVNFEIRQLFDEFQRITNTTEFNGQNLLNGSIGKVGLQLGDKRESGLDQVFLQLKDLNASQVFTKSIGTGSFGSRVSYRVGGTHSNIATGDLNGDGKMDMVAADTSTDRVSILLGNGDGTFQSPKVISPFGGTANDQTVVLKDLNRDGILDLAVNDSISQSVAILLGKGDGAFQLSATFDAIGASDPTWQTFDFGDMNGDGIEDLVTLSSIDHAVFYYRGRGDGTFDSGLEIENTGQATGGTQISLRLLDLNNDGKKDLEVLDYDYGYNNFFLSTGEGQVTMTDSIGGAFIQGTSADIDEDGKLDWIYGNAIFRGNGDGTFNQTTPLSLPTSSYNWAMGDINNDGHIDLIDTNLGRIEFGNGDGTFTYQPYIYSGSRLDSKLVDVNNDGVLDWVDADDTYGVGVRLGSSIQVSAIQNLDVSTQSNAQSLLKILDTAADALRSELSKVGGLHERLDSIVSSNLIRADSLEEARQNAISADIAFETAELVRLQILQQAQVAVLAQANSQMQIVLELLKPLRESSRLNSE